MHYSKLIKVSSGTSTVPLETKDMVSLFKRLSEMTKIEAPADFDKTQLTDDEIDDVLSYLTKLHDEYFQDVPLLNTLVKQFIWNIPHRMYDVFKTAIDYDEDIFNPILYLYIFCAEDPKDAIYRYVKLLRDKLIIPNNDLIDEYNRETDYVGDEENE